jgi:hypothetical protein
MYYRLVRYESRRYLKEVDFEVIRRVMSRSSVPNTNPIIKPKRAREVCQVSMGVFIELHSVFVLQVGDGGPVLKYFWSISHMTGDGSGQRADLEFNAIRSSVGCGFHKLPSS